MLMLPRRGTTVYISKFCREANSVEKQKLNDSLMFGKTGARSKFLKREAKDFDDRAVQFSMF